MVAPRKFSSILRRTDADVEAGNGSAAKVEKKTAKFKPPHDDSIEKRTFSVEGMTCASCVAYIERNIGKLDGMFFW